MRCCNKCIMFFCCESSKRLEPVCVMRCTFFHCPVFHSPSYDFCCDRIQLFSFINGLMQFFIHLFRQTLLHDLVIEYIRTKKLYHIDLFFVLVFHFLQSSIVTSCFSYPKSFFRLLLSILPNHTLFFTVLQLTYAILPGSADICPRESLHIKKGTEIFC